MLIYILLYILAGLFWSWLADRFLTMHGENKLGLASTAMFIFAWPIAIALVIYFMFQYGKGQR